MKLSVIIPAFNEEKRIGKTLEKVKSYLKKQSYEYEIIVVDDGSSDKTKEVAQDCKLISYRPNRGKGFAVKTGMLAGRGDWRLLMDADNSTDISQISKFWEFTNLNPKSETRNPKQYQNSNDQNYEIIIGSRYLNKDSIKVKQPLGRRIVSRLGNFLIRTTLGIKSSDTQCGFKLFSAKAAQDIFPLQQIERWGFDMEILAIAIKKHYKIKEVAVDWYDAEGSQVKKGAATKTLKELWQIKRNMWNGKY